MRKQGERLKAAIAALVKELDRAGRLRLKFALMQGGRTYSETTVRLLMEGNYDRHPGKDLIETMSDVLARFGKPVKARAS